MKSKFLSLSKSDFLKSLLMTVLGTIVTGLYSSISTGATPDIKLVVTAGIGSGCSYLIKNFFTNTQDKVFIPEVK